MMNRIITYLLLICLFISAKVQAQSKKDSVYIKKSYVIDEVVVTGTRNETDTRHLPMSISVVNREQIEQRNEQSLLPLLTEQVPGFFTTGRSIMLYNGCVICVISIQELSK